MPSDCSSPHPTTFSSLYPSYMDAKSGYFELERGKRKWKASKSAAGAVVGRAGPLLQPAIGQEEDGDQGTPPLGIQE